MTAAIRPRGIRSLHLPPPLATLSAALPNRPNLSGDTLPGDDALVTGATGATRPPSAIDAPTSARAARGSAPFVAGPALRDAFRDLTIEEQTPGPGETLHAFPVPVAPGTSQAETPSNGPLERTTLRDARSVSGLDQTAVGNATPDLLASDTILHTGDPRRIHRFAVLRQIGAGGMGVVYAGYDEELDRRVAIKVVREDLVASQGSARILREAQAMAKVSHPNVVQVYEVGEFSGQVFVAMEFIKGVTLGEWLTAEDRTWEETLEMYLQAGRGLAAAHHMGLVHRDFKPDNVLVGDGRARVLDFGLARAEGSRAPEADDSALVRTSSVPVHMLSTNLTMAGTILGTPAFMSPEQHLGEHTDARSDQFSFCVALYGALYGVAPFAGENFIDLSESVTHGKLRPPPAGTAVPAWVFAALRTGLAVAPADRHPSMDTLLAALTPDQVQMSRRRWQWPAALVGASLLAVVVTLAVTREGDPTAQDLQSIDRLTLEARDAASRMQWVYPTAADPRDTAYNRVVLLENLEGAAATPAFTAANGLRAEFAASLVVLGDRYFDDIDSRPYARDYYVQALVFVPTDPRASERSGVTLGQISDLQVRAGQGQFAEDELVAAEPLRILADPDRVRAQGSALAFARDAARGSALGRERAAAVFRKSGLLAADALTPDEPPPPRVAVVTPPPEPEPALADDPPTGEPVPTRLERERRLKTRPVEETKAAAPEPVAVPVPEPEPAEATKDPDGSRTLSDEAAAARRRGEVADAEKLYNQSLDLWNGNAAALIGLSDIYFERGNFDRAVKYAEKGVRADATADNLIRLGDAYFKVFRYSDAQQRYQRAAALGHPKAEERLTRVREKLGG